jgi:hypothetical protein
MLPAEEYEPLDQPSVNSFLAMVLAVGGFLLGLGIMYFAARRDPRSAAFVESPSGKVWILLIAAQVAFWAVVATPLWLGLRTLLRAFRDQLRGSRLQSVLFAGIFLALLSLAPRVLPKVDDPLAYHEWKIGLISAMGVVAVGVPALVGMLWVRIVAESVQPRVPTRDGEVYRHLRDSLQRLLRLVGAAVGLSTLSTGALLQALAENSPQSTSVSSQLVLLWGAGATVLVMLAYVPAYLSLRALGQGLITRVLPMPALGSSDWFDWEAKRKSLSAYLQLDQNLLDRLESGIFILAPLLSAAATVAVPR